MRRGLPAKVSVPEPRNLRLPSGFRTQDIYEYRTPLGLSLLALEKPSATLNLFERIAEQEEQEKASTAWRTVWWAAAVTAAALIALLVTVYFTDAAAARRWTTLVTRPDFEAERQHQVLLKTVARHRPDMLESAGVHQCRQERRDRARQSALQERTDGDPRRLGGQYGADVGL